MVGCFICGLILLALPILLYPKKDGLKLSPNITSVPIATYDSAADLAHYLVFDFIPIIGFGFLCVGYLVWKAYRKIKHAKKNDAMPDA